MFLAITLSVTFSKFNKTSICHQISRTYPWIEIQNSMWDLVTSLVKRARKGDSFITFFVHSNTTSWILSAHLQTQVIKPMLFGHVLDFEKVEQILEGFIVHQGTTFPQQIKYDNKLDPFIFLLPNLPQIQLMNHIVMKIGSIQCFIFLAHRILTILDYTLCHPKVICFGLFSPCMFM